MDKIKNSPLREAGLRMLVIMVYSVIVALNFKSFVQAGDLFPGGFTGLTRLLQRCAQEYWHITLPFAPLNLLFNAIPAAVSLKLIGKRFTMYSCLAIVFSSFFTDMIPAVPVTEDILLICVFGGLVNGFAISLCLQVRITSGGTDFIAIALAERKNMVIGGTVITGGRGRTLENRLRMLGIDHFYVDCMDKITAIREYMAGQGLDPANVIYMGDDIPDLDCMREVGLPVCPADAAAEVIEASRYVSEFRGGEGAVRDIVEQVLRARGDWARDSQGVTPSSLAASR